VFAAVVVGLGTGLRRAEIAQYVPASTPDTGLPVAVGALAVAHDGARLSAVFSQRAKASDPWRVMVASLGPSREVTATELPTGDAQAEGAIRPSP
jgi:hypothetical protein